MSVVVFTLILNVPLLLTNVLQYFMMTTTGGDSDVPLFSSYLGKFRSIVR